MRLQGLAYLVFLRPVGSNHADVWLTGLARWHLGLECPDELDDTPYMILIVLGAGIPTRRPLGPAHFVSAFPFAPILIPRVHQQQGTLWVRGELERDAVWVQAILQSPIIEQLRDQCRDFWEKT
ncbi:MAG TPA: hypothetical protein VFA09_22930 [Ktedonobacteraceae bacterium]|nr:hypothetical protein [Ktedonobacteraceae bacterium]